jgi:hypothetical protein
MQMIAGWVFTFAMRLTLRFAGWVVTMWIRLGRSASNFLASRAGSSIDPRFSHVLTVRTIVGLLLVVGAHLAWRSQLSDFWSPLNDWFGSILLNPILILGALLLASVMILVVTPQGMRRATIFRLWIPLRTAAISLGSFVGLIAAGALVNWIAYRPELPSIASVSIVLVGMSTVLFTASSWLVFGLGTVARDLFRARDGHPCLPALTVIAISLVAIVVAGLGMATGTLRDGFPEWVAITLLFGGPAVNVGLSLIELKLLARVGIGLRARLRWAPIPGWRPGAASSNNSVSPPHAGLPTLACDPENRVRGIPSAHRQNRLRRLRQEHLA